MRITKRLTAIIASGFALAATPDAEKWKKPRRAPLASDPLPASSPTSVPPPPGPPERPKASAAPPPPSTLSRGELVIFASGFALSAAAVVGIWMLLESDWSPMAKAPQTEVAAPRPTALASGQLASCPIEPVAAAASDKDGLFPLQTSVDGLIAADIASFIVIGNRAATAGRPRDAEAAFLMSCRVADKLKGAGSVELADAKYQLGAHYAKLALGGGAAAGANRAELLARAEALYLDSLQASIARYGEAHEKSRLAAQGLAAVRQTTAQSDNAQAAVAPGSAPDLVTAPGGPPKTPEPVGPGPTAALPARPLPARPPPANDAESKSRQDPSVLKKCPDAVAALGLCTPGN